MIDAAITAVKSAVMKGEGAVEEMTSIGEAL